MREVAVSAPGKAILLGEHAAVYGHPAIVAALDLRTRVTLREREGARVELDLPVLGFRGTTEWNEILNATREARESWRKHVGGGGGWTPAGEPAPERLVTLALGEAAGAAGQGDPPGLTVRVESDLPPGSGFGSSAALAVAVVAAYLTYVKSGVASDRIGPIALEVERRQHGTPSGIDTAAAILGGVLWVRRAASGALGAQRLKRASPLLERLRLFHSGTPASSTGATVAAVRRRLEAAPDRVRPALAAIESATLLLRAQLEAESEDPDATVASIRSGSAALEDLGVVPEPVRAVLRRIEALGGAAKISGAGSIDGTGGGLVLAYHPDPVQLDHWALPSGWRRFDVRLGAPGLRAGSPR